MGGGVTLTSRRGRLPSLPLTSHSRAPLPLLPNSYLHHPALIYATLALSLPPYPTPTPSPNGRGAAPALAQRLLHYPLPRPFPLTPPSPPRLLQHTPTPIPPCLPIPLYPYRTPACPYPPPNVPPIRNQAGQFAEAALHPGMLPLASASRLPPPPSRQPSAPREVLG